MFFSWLCHTSSIILTHVPWISVYKLESSSSSFGVYYISPWVTLVPSKCQTFPFWMPEEKLLFNNGTLKVMRKPYNCVQLNITHNGLGFHSRACPTWVCKNDREGMLKHIFLDPSSRAFCSLVLVWGLWFCISNKLLSDSEAIGPRTTFYVVLV